MPRRGARQRAERAERRSSEASAGLGTGLPGHPPPSGKQRSSKRARGGTSAARRPARAPRQRAGRWVRSAPQAARAARCAASRLIRGLGTDPSRSAGPDQKVNDLPARTAQPSPLDPPTCASELVSLTLLMAAACSAAFPWRGGGRAAWRGETYMAQSRRFDEKIARKKCAEPLGPADEPRSPARRVASHSAGSQRQAAGRGAASRPRLRADSALFRQLYTRRQRALMCQPSALRCSGVASVHRPEPQRRLAAAALPEGGFPGRMSALNSCEGGCNIQGERAEGRGRAN